MHCIFRWSIFFCVVSLYCMGYSQHRNNVTDLKLNDLGYFEARGLNVFVFSNWYDGNFSDSKISGIEINHHGVRTATNGDVRLSPTPGQWDPIPQFKERKVNKENNTVEAYLSYPKFNFEYMVKAEA